MIKKATNISDQIELLISRGMTIADRNKAEETLLDIGYYRLGFYWFPFEITFPRKDNRDHKLNEVTTFEQFIQLYYFDFDIRNLLLRYISRIEINFRTKLIYFVSNKYKDDPFWYVNPTIIQSSFIEEEYFKQCLNDIQKEYVIIHDLKTHERDYAPAWKAVEYMSFGVIIGLFKNLKDEQLKHNIAVQYGVQSSTQFIQYLNTIRRLRNLCAHGKVIFDMSLSEAIPTSGPIKILNAHKQIFNGAFLVTKYILSRVSNNRANEMQTELNRIKHRISNTTVREVIANYSGLDMKTT